MDLILPLLFVLIGIGALYQTYTHYGRYRTVRSIAANVDRGGGEGETTVHGPVDVAEPATPDRERPVVTTETANSPALVAWRIRRKIRTGGRNRRSTSWRTAEGGLAIGEFSVLHGGRYVRVDAEELTSDLANGRVFDPFDASNVHLGEPETDVRLGDPDPITKALERIGLIGDGGLLSGLEISVSVGRWTLTPNRYQEVAIDEGDELAIQGTTTETDDGPVIRGTDDRPPVFVGGNLEKRGSELRRGVGTQLGLAGVMFALAVATPDLLAALGF